MESSNSKMMTLGIKPERAKNKVPNHLTEIDQSLPILCSDIVLWSEVCVNM